MQPSHWFTPPRVERLGRLLEVLPSRLEPVPTHSAVQIVWNHVGGPVDEVGHLLDEATACGLIESTPEGVGRTAAGTRARNQLREGDPSSIASRILRSGALADQARRLVQNIEYDPGTDCFRCPLSVRREIPQLIAILRLKEEVVVGESILLTRAMYEEVGAVWVFMEAAEHLPPWLRERQLVGHLAELFSWNHERLHVADPSKVKWVSKDDDSLGYDIEDLNPAQRRRIEVKGSRGPDVQFIMSPNEMAKARRHGDCYEIHFWGQLNVAADPQSHYAASVAAGYPVVIVDPAVEFDLGGWSLEPDGWRISMI